jgi:chorismate mutase
MNMTDAENKLLGHLRTTLTEVDGRILELVAERQRLVEEIGRSKQVKGQATRDFAREKDVIEGAVDRARGLGIPSDTVEALMRLLIRSSLTTQERDRVSSEGRTGHRRGGPDGPLVRRVPRFTGLRRRNRGPRG